MRAASLLVGVDFDNTIVCYDELFWQLAMDRQWVDEATPHSKEAIRTILRSQGYEDRWTELQGFAYGTEILRATPFPGVYDFFQKACERKISLRIISHKTRRPFRGPDVDLHAAARSWLVNFGFFSLVEVGLTDQQVFFEETKQGKLMRIADQCCTHFIDDLPEFLLEPNFPAGVHRILFSSRGLNDIGSLDVVQNWFDLTKKLQLDAET